MNNTKTRDYTYKHLGPIKRLFTLSDVTRTIHLLLEQILMSNPNGSGRLFLIIFKKYLNLKFTERDWAGAPAEVNEIISWIARRSLSRWSGFWMPISRWICWSDKLDIIAPDLTFDAHAETYLRTIFLNHHKLLYHSYHWGMPTHSSNQATIVAPFHSEKGVPSVRTFSTNSCFFFCRRCCSLFNLI